MNLDYQQAVEILQHSEILYTKQQIDERIKDIARQIVSDLGHEIPIFLNVMNGGVFFFTELLKNIDSPSILDYVHATRYNNTMTGGKEIKWLYQPKEELLKDKIVYIIDDILDEGNTLNEIRNFVINCGAKDCKIVVLIDKLIDKAKPVAANYTGFSSPNKYLFGYGMDIFGLYRQTPNIYFYSGSL